MKNIKGIYKHFKGNKYEVFGECFNEKDNENYVLYKTMYDDSGYWIRPFDMFFETIERDNNVFERFSFIENSDNEIFNETIVVKHSETLEQYEIKVLKENKFTIKR